MLIIIRYSNVNVVISRGFTFQQQKECDVCIGPVMQFCCIHCQVRHVLNQQSIHWVILGLPLRNAPQNIEPKSISLCMYATSSHIQCGTIWVIAHTCILHCIVVGKAGMTPQHLHCMYKWKEVICMLHLQHRTPEMNVSIRLRIQTYTSKLEERRLVSCSHHPEFI